MAPAQISFHGVQRSDAVEQYIRKHAEKLNTLAPRIVGCRIAVELPHRHAHHGEHYRIRIDITVPGGEVVADRVPDGDRAYEDVYGAIDAAFDDAGRRLQDFVRRQRGDVKQHDRSRQRR
jgi:ribosome-associated translation inhibitor RaiA